MKGFWGAMLMAAGILIAGLSGLCSLIFLVGGGDSEILGLVLVIGGVPFAVGLGLFFLGRKLARDAAKIKPDVSQEFE